MKYLMPLLILINCLMIQGILEWTVSGKVTDYGQNVTLLCHVPKCCPKDSGWDRWTPNQRTLFIDVKTGRPNKKYDGKVLKDGYTLIIQNLTKNDLNVSYSCLYGVTLGERKFLMEEDVFTFDTQPDVPTGNSRVSSGEIGAIITGITVAVIVLVSIFIYFWIKRSKKQERKETSEEREMFLNARSEQEEITTMHLKEKKPMQFLKRMKREKNAIPRNIRDQIKKQIEVWEKNDKKFVSTRASDYVMELLQDNRCLTLTAPSGVGKSFIARHTALLFKMEGYNIIPVDLPADIKTYYQPGKKTVFIVDDICGNFTANQQQIDNWKHLLPVINNIIADKCCKIIVSCRLQVYKDEKFNVLLPFKSCECNLISDKLGLTSVEKTNIAKTYLGTIMTNIDDLSSKCDFFPLLCSLYHGKEDVDDKDYFKNPFVVYKCELDRLSEHGDEGKHKICSLALCVLFNNQLKEKWFQGKMTDEQGYIIKDTCETCGFNSIPKTKLKKSLDTLDGTFICKQNGIYRTVHDKLFDFLAHYFGQKNIECLIDHGDSNLVHERFIWQTSPDDKNSNIDFIIEIPDDYLESYLVRLIKDWSKGKVSVVFSNNNMEDSSFRQKLIQFLLQLDKPQQVILASTKDTVEQKESYGSGNTPLILTCYFGYTDMVQWMLHKDVDVDQCRDDEATGLFMASQVGHTDIVKLLLEKNPNIDLCDDDGCSALHMASQNGHSDIVKLLLERNPDVDLCNNDGLNPLISACITNQTSIVQLLMKHKPNINAQTYDGGNALYFSAMDGNIEITQLLLENNADCNICIHSKQSITDTLKNHPSQTLDIEKQELFESLVEKTSSHVTDYVKKKSVDYAFDVVAGSSPLHIACFTGRLDIVSCLLDHNANINMKKEDGTTPVFFACEVGHEDLVRLLLDKGADTQICRLDGKSPLKIATDNGHESIVMIVTEHTKKKDKLLNSCSLDT